jgi:phytol kinase
MLAQTPYAVIVTGTVMAGLWVSNFAYDRKVPQYVSRKIGHAAGGVGFLICALFFPTAWWPIILCAGFGFILWGARLSRPRTFRGVGGSGRNPNVMAEVWFPWVGVPVFAIGWLWLDKPFIALACLLFMAWGDGVSGLVRAAVYGKPVKGLWGSVGMLGVCLIISWIFITPFWLGVVGSVVATAVEWSFGDVGLLKWADDNWAIPVLSLACLLGLAAMTGNL